MLDTFASVGARRFDITFLNIEGEKRGLRREQSLMQVRNSLPLLFPGMTYARIALSFGESHLQLHIDDNLRLGMSPEEARREAVLKLGGVEPTKEAYRDGGTAPLVQHALQDLRFSLRQHPGFTCTATAMLALGLCASVTIFAFVDAALLKPLPYSVSAGAKMALPQI